MINRCGHGDFDSQPVHVVEDVVWVNPQLGDVVVDHCDALVLVVQHRDREQLRLKELWQRCQTKQLKCRVAKFQKNYMEQNLQANF